MKKQISNNLLLPIILFLLTFLINEKTMSDEKNITRHYIKIETQGAIVDVFINDIPIFKNLDTDGAITTEPANLWLRNKENTLSYKIHHYDDESYKPKINLTVFVHDEKQEIPTPKTVLAKLSHPSEENIEYPFSETIEFKVDNNIPTKLWNDIEKITNLSQSDKSEMIETAQKLSNAILKGTDEAINLQLYKIQDDALAEGKTVEKLKEIASKSYEWLRSQGSIKADAIILDEVNFDLCANGHMINIIRNNNEDIIVLESDEMYFDVNLFFSKIDGKWVIVR